ncbi:hypothetical protein GFY24_07360 [Nocardia sp. SYP-A9097]|uniref:hypothetical protein n=1 Tax=Nocardia sp. SYP-A9097 TaxID=2663237 RepID=UPI00129AE86C|nr:hypothetical protein [Nocardia sp. SYP-A9097]MRH87280.1 hypothetical protein [Nocardia sp. SYP-A9097]
MRKTIYAVVVSGMAFALALAGAAAPASAKDSDVDMQEQCRVQYPATKTHNAGSTYLEDKNNAYTWHCRQDPAVTGQSAITGLGVDVQAFCIRRGLGNAMARDIHNAYSWKCATVPTPGTGDTWTDCSGPAVCTRYWSRAKTTELDDAFQGLAWKALLEVWAKAKCAGPRGSAAVAALSAICGATEKAEYQASLDGLPEAAHAGARAHGCLQVAWRKDGAEQQKWGYTTDSGYCWNG